MFKMNLTKTVIFLSERNLTVFTAEFHIFIPLSNLSQILSLNKNLGQICHLVFPFSLPTLFFDRSALCINLVCQRIFTRSAGSSVAGGAGNPAARNAVCLVGAGGLGPGGIGNSSVVVAVCLAIECMGCSAGALSILLLLALQITIPVPFYIFYKWDNLVPIHISLFSASVPQWHGRVAVLWGFTSTFIVGVDVGVGGLASPFWTQTSFMMLTLFWAMGCLP